MKNPITRVLAFVVFGAIMLNMLPINSIKIYASNNSEGWMQIDSNTFMFENNVAKGSDIIYIINNVYGVYADAYRLSFSDLPDDMLWIDHSFEIFPDGEYSFDFYSNDTLTVFFIPKYDWNSTTVADKFIVKKHDDPITEPTDLRNPAIVDALISKDFGRFDTELEFENAVRATITASWSNAVDSGKVDPSNVHVAFTLFNISVNENGETVKNYSVSVNISEGTNWLESERETIFEGVNWTVNQYAISFDTKGGSEIAPIKQDYGTPITPPSNPIREGYEFAGWDRDIPQIMPGEDLVINAQWLNSAKNVSFDPNGGKWDDESTGVLIETHESTYDPHTHDKPNRTGYEFVCWNEDKSGVAGADASYIAVWKEKLYTVRFYDQNGDLIEGNQYKYGEPIIIPEIVIPAGYIFIGWDKDIPANMPTEDLEFKAVFNKNQYTIFFNTDGGSEIAPITQEYGTQIIPPIKPTKYGCEFDGWDIAIPQTMPSQNITITARWKRNEYSITFDTDGGSSINPKTFKYGDNVSVQERPTKVGCTFIGWDKEIPETMPAENLSFKALWKINSYTITFDTAGGNVISPITQEYGTSIVTPQNPMKAYHTFAGWDKEIPSTMPAENITITARWNVNSYTITFDTAGGSAIEPITQGYGTPVAKPENPTKDCYKFIGWDKEIPSTMPGENVLITAKWEESKKTVSFDPNGGKWTDGTDVIKVENFSSDYNAFNFKYPTKEGYDFGGWQKNEPIAGVDESYFAIWISGQTVIFKDGESITERHYAFGEAIVIPKIPERLGYTFVGWDLVGANGVPDGFKDSVPSVMGTESMVFVAIWEAKEYTVLFYNENDEIIEAITEKYGTPFAISIDPDKTGYSFIGWDLKKNGVYDGVADALSTVMGAENLEYRAIFAIGTFTITFDTAGGSAVPPITQSYGTPVIPPAHPIKEGFVFEGWDIGVPQTMPAKNVTIVAKWRKASYTIKWDINADGVINDYDIVTTVDHGQIPALPAGEIPTRESTAEFLYEFNNTWYPDLKPADGDVTYTAQYNAVKRKYTVKFLNYDGSLLMLTEHEYGSLPQYKGTTPTKIDDIQYDYTFVDWNPKLETVKGDAVYTAVFSESIKKYTVVWKNWDGSVLETDFGIEHGDLPLYNGKIPQKSGSEEKNYVFAGWTPQISGVSSDVTYTATFTEKVNSYSITWKNEDGSIIDITVVEYGQIPSYASPSKQPTAENTFSFSGWTPAVVAVVGDATYTATYIATKNKYTVVWNVDGIKTVESYEYGAIPEFKGSVEKTPSGCSAFTFSGWNMNISAVTGNIEYIAQYSAATKHISDDFIYQSNANGTHTKRKKCCNAVIGNEACSDSENDGNHKCDLCFADNIGSHKGGVATCISLAFCNECGEAYGGYDLFNHESEEIVYSDITKNYHSEMYACCKALKIANASHSFVGRTCACGEKKASLVVFMNGSVEWRAFECGADGLIHLSAVSDPPVSKGYVFDGWYTLDGIRFENTLKPEDDIVFYAKFVPGDVDGNEKIEARDADILNRYIVGEKVWIVDDRTALDVNGDGRVTVLDSVAIMLYISKNR